MWEASFNFVSEQKIKTVMKQKAFSNAFMFPQKWEGGLWIVSSTFQIAQILVQSHFELISSVLALEATEPLAEPVAELAVELINNHLISVHQKR